ncbi:MAG TPA: filamentous hemagglutinin N-terminal domain-containing protein, partial [Burkholderiales bacterium]|nr:filamentous hemagglutinin N-terminal domain-containing protein [Burkholderiales bacterium]
MSQKGRIVFSARKRLIAAAISACFSTTPAWANPTGPQVVNGAASFSQTGDVLNVNNSNGAIINWNSFSIGADETTRFNQASAASSVLNRVVANDPSVLLGTLSSNGHVWLVNPAGIMVGQGAKIDVAGFVASTLNVANQDFLAGRLNFGATPNAGSVQNDGQITTPSGGSVYLVAPSVSNNGIIDAPNGEVILAAGQTVQLLDTGTPGVSVAITGAQGNVTNLGRIVSEAGQIGIAGVLVKNSGTLNASS